MTNKDLLRIALKEICTPDEIEENDADGFSIKPKGWGWTAFTVYVNGARFDCYEAIPDLKRAVDIADEKLEFSQGTAYTLQCFLRGALHRMNPKLLRLASVSDF